MCRLALVALALVAGCGEDLPGEPDLRRARPDLSGAGEDIARDPYAEGDLGAPDLASPATDGSVAVDAGGPPGVYGGHCDAPFPNLAKKGWRHNITSPTITALGGPNHRIRDVILATGEASKLRGRFTYGTVDKDLGDEDVELWLQRCPAWEKIGTLTTDKDGIVWFDVPGTLPAGDYKVRMVVLGDLSTADGMVAVWRPGMQAIVTDIDGTLTTSDWETYKDVIFGGDATMYADADRVIKEWARKGYRIVYLTARPQIVNRYSRAWLAKRGFPFGPLRLAEDTGVVADAHAEKLGFLNDTKKRVGVVWRPAYGNATTDITAYETAGIPKADTYIIGPEAGKMGTVAVKSYGAHFPAIAGYPDAKQP
jgi:hypothetical protein